MHMRSLLFNILAAGILIGIRIIGPLWICRRSKQIKMKKLIIILAIMMALVSCTKVISKPGPLVAHPAPYVDPTLTKLDTIFVDR